MTGQLSMFAAPARERRTGSLPAPAPDSPLRLQPPTGLYLGTSSWSFPGWKGLVWDGQYAPETLARHGLAAYAALGLFRTVGIDRTYYEPIDADAFATYAAQVNDGFRFLVKAPQLVTDAVIRSDTGQERARNPHHLGSAIATDRFVVPAMEGLGQRAGPLVFQFPPMTPEILAEPARWTERLGDFLVGLPRAVAGRKPIYAVELRNPELLTPRLIRLLREANIRYVMGLHARMPGVARQVNALRVLDGCASEVEYAPSGPVIVRWNLRPGLRYEQARSRYFPFDRLVDEDLQTRHNLAALAHAALKAGQPVWIIANNKAEGSAPLTLLALHAALADMIRCTGTPRGQPS